MANPTSYVFASSVDSVAIAIWRAYGNRPRYHLSSAHDSIITYGKQVFSLPNNKDDFYLHRYGFDTSHVFERLDEKEQFVPYFVEHHLHLQNWGRDSTRVEVTAIDPRIVIGTVDLPEPGFAATRPVSPSTIEEYEILLEIGRELGTIETMPRVMLPERQHPQ